MAVSDEGLALLRDLRGKTSRKLNLNVGIASAAAYSPDGNLLAVASGSGFARVWETATWHQIATLGGFPRYVESVAFSADGTRLATGSGGRQAIKLFDIQSWQELLALEGTGAMFLSTAFSTDGSALGSLNGSGELRIWQAPSWPQIEAAEKASPKRAAMDLPKKIGTFPSVSF